MPLVIFHNADVLFKLNRKRDLKQFISHIFTKEEKTSRSINIIFCSDEFLLGINKRFLNHNYYTDIITFDLDLDGDFFSELYISIERVKENKETQNVSLWNEIHRIIFHGILHLCGYKDKTTADKRVMTQKEDEYLKEFELFHVKQKIN